MSRREMLGLAGVAAIGLSPVARAVESSVIGPFECVVRRGRVSFRLSGADRWVIDTHRFTGSPDLTVAKSDGLINIKLSNARYPGTDLPADLTCDIRRGLVGWQMTLKMKLGGFRADVPFERWLIGRATAESAVRLEDRVCDLDARSGLELQGKAEAVFRPNWTFSVNGRNVARLSIEDQQAAADSLSISLLGSGDPSLVTKPAPNRSLVVLKRGNADWAPGLFLNEIPADWGRCCPSTSSGCAFDAISLELGEHKTGLPQRTLLAESLDDETRLQSSVGRLAACRRPGDHAFRTKAAKRELCSGAAGHCCAADRRGDRNRSPHQAHECRCDRQTSRNRDAVQPQSFGGAALGLARAGIRVRKPEIYDRHAAKPGQK